MSIVIRIFFILVYASKIINCPRSDRSSPQSSVVRIKERLISNLLHLLPHSLGHLDQYFVIFWFISKIESLVPVISQIVEFVDASRAEHIFPVAIPHNPLSVNKPLPEKFAIRRDPVIWISCAIKDSSETFAVSIFQRLSPTKIE